MRKRIASVACLLAIPSCLASGCGVLHARTSMGAGVFGWHFTDTKDNDISFDEASYDPATKQFSIKGLVIRNNASDPMIANVQQIMAIVEQQKAANEGLKVFMDGIQPALSLLGGLQGIAASEPSCPIGEALARLTQPTTDSGGG